MAVKIFRVFLNFAHALLFYPVMVGVFAWLYFTKTNWIWGALVILIVIVLDPLWRTMARTAIFKFKDRE